MKLFDRVADYLIQRSKKTPYSHLPGYMLRYWLVPYVEADSPQNTVGVGRVRFLSRPIAWVLQRLGIAIRVHCILASDRANEFHDHPWNYISIILRGSYYEITPHYDKSGLYLGAGQVRCISGDALFRKAQSWHRLELVDGETWTLFITFRKRQVWGFMRCPDNKVFWRDYLQEADDGSRV